MNIKEIVKDNTVQFLRYLNDMLTTLLIYQLKTRPTCFQCHLTTLAMQLWRQKTKLLCSCAIFVEPLRTEVSLRQARISYNKAL